MLQENSGTAEGLLIAFFLLMSVVLGLVILWVARQLRVDPADPLGKVAASSQKTNEPVQNIDR